MFLPLSPHTLITFSEATYSKIKGKTNITCFLLCEIYLYIYFIWNMYMYILYALHKAEEDFLGQGRRPVKNGMQIKEVMRR